jgi:polyphosphate:AMP phosphotransferase
MFEAAEVGRKISKEEWERSEPDLQVRLLQAQREATAAGIPVIVIVSGVEGAGKGSVVNRFNSWLDTRGIETSAFWDKTDEERERPPSWRFVRRLPPRGSMAIFFGSWYSEPIVDRAFGEDSPERFERRLGRIEALERMLVDDGALLVKLWFHLPRKAQRKRLKEKKKRGGDPGVRMPFARRFAKRYQTFLETSEVAIRKTDHGHAPWHIIEASNRRYRDLAAGYTLLQSLRHRLDEAGGQTPPLEHTPIRPPDVASASQTILDQVDLSASVERDAYERELDELQDELNRLSWKAWEKGVTTVAVFEGWDAAGKGGAIRRVTRAVDARIYRVIQVAAPTDEELAHHYMWRFSRQLPRAGHLAIYDRSWYGRVLVERVEGLARPDEWQRAYSEINDFERELCEHGIVLMKFWLQISPEEQLARFEERQQNPTKRWKITDEDWRNREKRAEYEEAVNEMVTRTSTARAPWVLVPGDDKLFARLEVLRTFVARLGEALEPNGGKAG